MRIISTVAMVFVLSPVLLMLLLVSGVVANKNTPPPQSVDARAERQNAAPIVVTTPATPTPDPRPGSPEVYARIASSTDCAALQKDFDTAEAAHGPALARGRPDLAAISTEYIKAADARMRQINCYSR